MKFLKYVKTMLYGYIALILAIGAITVQSLVASSILVLMSFFNIWLFVRK